MRRLWFFVHKEWLLLSRDIHGLLLLFVMPTVFVAQDDKTNLI